MKKIPPNGASKAAPSRPSETGSVLILVVLLLSLLAFIPVGTKLLETSRKQVKLQANANAQAVNIARAGITDAEAWFRMQTSQPVSSSKLGSPYPDAAFQPLAISATGSEDTIDATTGLVKELKLGEKTNLYGRYIVYRQRDPDNNGTISASEYDSKAVHDITAMRITGGTAGQGLAWYIESTGLVYQKKSTGAYYNAAQDVIVGRARVATELRRMTINHFTSAVAIVTRGNATVGANCRVTGGSGTGGVSNSGTGTWSNTTGTPAMASTTTAVTLSNVFGVNSYDDIRMVADWSVTSVNDLPADLPSTALIYVQGNATFDDTRPLTGGGVLVVNGNLTVQSTANAYFSGLIFVEGDATINGPALISGSLMVNGAGGSPDLTLSGTSGVAEIQWDSDRISALAQNVGRYRQNKSTFHVFSALK